MKNTNLRHLMLLSLAGLLAVASPGPAAVFCVADNGHAAVEGISSPCCESETAPFAPTEILEPSDADQGDAECTTAKHRVGRISPPPTLELLASVVLLT
jgi:hypothetical protein